MRCQNSQLARSADTVAEGLNGERDLQQRNRQIPANTRLQLNLNLQIRLERQFQALLVLQRTLHHTDTRVSNDSHTPNPALQPSNSNTLGMHKLTPPPACGSGVM